MGVLTRGVWRMGCTNGAVGCMELPPIECVELRLDERACMPRMADLDSALLARRLADRARPDAASFSSAVRERSRVVEVSERCGVNLRRFWRSFSLDKDCERVERRLSMGEPAAEADGEGLLPEVLSPVVSRPGRLPAAGFEDFEVERFFSLPCRPDPRLESSDAEAGA